MAEIIKTLFQLRRGLAEAWERNNPLLAPGEPGYELDTHKVKIGDGTSLWKDLPYIGEQNIVSYYSAEQLPTIGNVNYIYKVNKENMLYHWSEQEKKFVPLGPSGVGSDEIEYIDGGNASGFNY